MNGWERHKPALIVAGAFLAAAFLLWLVGLRGFGRDYAEAHRRYAAARADQENKFTEGEDAARVKVRLERANAALAAAYDDEAARRLHTFKHDAVSADMGAASTHLISELTHLEARFDGDIVRRCSISVSDAIPMNAGRDHKSLGFDLSTAEQAVTPDIVRLRKRQFEVVDRFRELLVAVHARVGAGGAGAPSAKPIESLTEFRAQLAPANVNSRAETNLFREYRVEAKLRLTWPALLALLEESDTPEHFHVVRTLDVNLAADSAGVNQSRRASVLVRSPGEPPTEDRDGRRITREVRRYVNYYDVSLTLATLTAVDDAEVGAVAAPKPTGGGRGANLMRPTTTTGSGDEPPKPRTLRLR